MARRKKLPVVLETEEVEKLLSIPNKRYITGIRNRAILTIMVNMGLRVSEVTNLRPGDINLTKNKLRIVQGKGGVDRDLTIGVYASEILSDWKEAKPKNTEYFFTTLKDRKCKITFKNGIQRDITSKPGAKLSVRNIQFMVKRYAERAGINKNVTPHTLRHSFATNFIRQNGNVMNLKKILGHSDISTTQIYVTLANIDVENAMNQFIEIKAK